MSCGSRYPQSGSQPHPSRPHHPVQSGAGRGYGVRGGGSVTPAPCSQALPRPEETDTAFDFHLLHYPSVKIADSKKVAVRWTNTKGKSLVYFNRDLRCGRKLILQIESAVPGRDFGLIFGVTTCSPAQVFEYPYHLIDYCKPDYDCCGVSVWMKLWNCNRVGSCLVAERVYDGFIRFTINGRGRVDMADPPERGFGRSRSYPFLMLTGSVASVRILSAVPAEEVGYARPFTRAEPPGPLVRFFPPQQDNSFATDSWMSNRHVAVKGFLLKRQSATGANQNYTFNRQPFSLGKVISFQVKDTDRQLPGTLTFGVTTHSPDSVTLDNLPINSNELTTNRFSKNWYLSQDIIETAQERHCFSLKRTANGFTLKSGYKQIRYLFYVDPTLIVYPFFNFNGAVSSIELLRNSAAVFNMTSVAKELEPRPTKPSSPAAQGKCVICLDERADHMSVPCNHVAFCQSCSTQTMTRSDRKCPLCRTQIDRIAKIFLA